MEIRDVEIMAPVGSYESLAAAIQAGAGSVYFGVEQLNMRARSSNNFTLDDLRNICALAHGEGVKTYLTLNAILFDDDLAVMRRVVDAAKEAGVSAVIAGDLAVIQYARRSGVEVHISTQVNITNIEAVRFYAAFADVMVLAREMDLVRVAEISQQIREEEIRGPRGELIRLEMFVHGALCMAVSGKCYLSLHQMNVSANRGACMQICRRAYTVTDKESGDELEIDNEYIMSPKDLKTIHFLDRILEAGVTVLKVEGRARAPEYVKTVVSCYREAVEAWLGHSVTEEKVADWDRRLATVFNRGFWDGYYLGQRLGEWSGNYGSLATERKVYVGRGMNYFPNLGVAEFKVEAGSIRAGDKILITGPTTGVVEAVAEEIRVDLQAVAEAKKGEFFSVKIDQKIRRSDKLYKLVVSKKS